jgi:hypothetical protein
MNSEQELEEEIRILELQLFWENYGIDSFKKAINNINNYYTGCQCGCFSCGLRGGYKNFTNRNKYDKCPIPNIVNDILQKFELEWKVIGLYQVEGNIPFFPDENLLDSRNIHLSSNYDYASGFNFGSKLWNSKNVNDPELFKYSNFIDWTYGLHHCSNSDTDN